MSLYLALNIAVMFIAGRWSVDAFNEGSNFWGWMHLIASAINAGGALLILFPN